MLIDWLAAGLNPGVSTLFVQSQVPEHAELHLLLSMITPLGWLERVPSYKDQQEQLKEKDLATYGFLGYPLLQTADILLYKPGLRAGGRGPGRARGDHARGRAPLQSPVRPRAGLRDQGREGHQAARRPQQHDVQAAAQEIPGERRPAGAREGAPGGRDATRASRWRIANGC